MKDLPEWLSHKINDGRLFHQKANLAITTSTGRVDTPRANNTWPLFFALDVTAYYCAVSPSCRCSCSTCYMLLAALLCCCVLQSTVLYTVWCTIHDFLAELESRVDSLQYEVSAAAGCWLLLYCYIDDRLSMLGDCLAATSSQNKLPAFRDIFSYFFLIYQTPSWAKFRCRY